jgi:hypothetical protein
MIKTGEQTLGGYAFYWDPDNMDIPEKKKDVAESKTYGGSAIFEWAAILEGTKVVLEWKYMPKGMYTALRLMYLQIGTAFIWNPQTGGNTYNVRITDLQGDYFGTVHHEGPFRRNVKMILSVRSLAAVLQSTTTTTTSTTTT